MPSILLALLGNVLDAFIVDIGEDDPLGPSFRKRECGFLANARGGLSRQQY